MKNKTYRVHISFNKFIEIKAQDSEQAQEIAAENMFNNFGEENTVLQNELEVRTVCLKCGVSLILDEELEDGQCIQCANNKRS